MIFAKVWELYQAIFARIAAATGARPHAHPTWRLCRLAHFAADVSRGRLADQPGVGFPVRAGGLSFLRSIHPSACRLSRAAQLGLHSAWRRHGPSGRRSLVAGSSHAAAGRSGADARRRSRCDPPHDRRHLAAPRPLAPAVTLCTWSFDRNTPLENAAALYDAVS